MSAWREEMARMLAQVKATVRLEEVCRSRGIDLTSSRGERWEGRCPFHEDRTPSFNVYVQTQRYCCFGCGAQGDVIDLVRALDGCSFQEALQRLMPASLAGTPRKPSPSARRPLQRASEPSVALHEHENGEYSVLLTRVLLIYHETLLHTPAAQDYLASRGISLATIQSCMLGYADGRALCHALVDHEQLWQQAQRVGLLTRSGKEWLMGRLIIPDLRKRTCTWMIGRLLPTRIHPVCKANDKYIGLALPKTLLGYDAALEMLGAQQRPLHGILILEGAIDYVLAQEWQLPFLCVALLGTHASRQQLQALLHLHDVSKLPFLVWLDADERGRLATLHLLKQLQGYPFALIPEIATIKDLADLGTRPDGYARFRQAWHAIGDGGEV
jgi:DNA primase catalytic core